MARPQPQRARSDAASTWDDLAQFDHEVAANTSRSWAVLFHGDDAVATENRTLVERTRIGDRDAFDALLRRHYRASLAVALGVLSRLAEAEDVCQDAWVRVAEHIDELREPDCFRGWMLQIVRNLARNHLAAEKVRASERPEVAESLAGGVQPPDAGRIWLRSRLEKVLSLLGETQRTVVLLHDLEGWRHKEIATRLGISEVMSRQHLHQARKRLRRYLAGVAGREDES
jgi:RNA polymerase sigma-70 factor (ECF subfamily)